MVDVTSFRYNYGVAGYFERIERGNGRSLKLTGWAKDTNRASNDDLRVEVRLDGRKIGETKSFDPREDVAKAWDDDFIDSGFEFEVPTVPLRFGRESLLVVEAVASGQRECLFAAPTGGLIAGHRSGMLQRDNSSGLQESCSRTRPQRRKTVGSCLAASPRRLRREDTKVSFRTEGADRSGSRLKLM